MDDIVEITIRGHVTNVNPNSYDDIVNYEINDSDGEEWYWNTGTKGITVTLIEKGQEWEENTVIRDVDGDVFVRSGDDWVCAGDPYAQPKRPYTELVDKK